VQEFIKKFTASMKKNFVLLLILAVLFAEALNAQRNKPIDADATKETKALYHNLKNYPKDHMLFGHKHATEYGHGWSGDENRSDVKSVVGSHPAVIGVDFSGFTAGQRRPFKNQKRM